MSRFALFIFALLAFVTLTFASPAPIEHREIVDIEKRSTGRGTWYYPGLGNCGGYNSNTDLVLAISKSLYNQNNGGYCYQQVAITFNGVTVYGTTVDSCESCTDSDIDMSPSLFQELAPLSDGVIEVTWNFM